MKIVKSTFVFILVFLFNIASFSQVKDTLYFDKNWKETDWKNHQFYRLLPLKTIGELSLLVDYHKSGKMQMQGYVYTNNIEKFVGDVYWYYESGLDNSHSSYKNKTNRSLKYYHNNGALWKEVHYKNNLKEGVFKVYGPKNKLRYSTTYKKDKNVGDKIDYFSRKPYDKDFTYTLYWLGSPKKAMESKYLKKIKILKQEIYSKTGTLLKSYKESDFVMNQNKTGTDKEKTENGFVVSFETDIYKNHQSKVITLNDIDYININTNYYNFIKENSATHIQPLRLRLFYDKAIPEKLLRTELFKTREKRKNKSDLISVKKIKKQSVKQLLKTISEKQWESVFKKKRYYGKDSMKYKSIFKQYNKSLFVSLELKKDDGRRGGFGSYYSNDDDEKIKWRTSSVGFYTINVIKLNGNRPILALSHEGDLEYFVVPLEDGSFITNCERSDMKLKDNSTLEKDIALDIMKYEKTNTFYRKLPKNKKSYIANEFNEILIDKPYDSIQRVGQFIIGRKAKVIDIYNLKLDKLPLKSTRAAYFDRNNLQVLSNNEAYFINLFGAKTKRQEISYSFCGTVSSTRFLIVDSIKKSPIIKVHYGGMTREPFNEIVYLTNLKNKQDITFLNKRKRDGYNGNSSFVDGYRNRTQTLLVKNNNKFGLYIYSKDDLEAKAKELLPIEYDSIELREPLIILQKGNKSGIYKDKRGLIYKSLGKVNVNFMRYEKINGEKGWLDINTFKDYPDK